MWAHFRMRLVVVEGHCHCLSRCKGRVSDIMIVEHKYISTPALTLIFKSQPVKQYPVVEETANQISIKIAEGHGYS